MARPKNYEWVTDEMFDRKLEELLSEEPAGGIMQIPGVYELLSEHFNNAVLDALDEERGSG